MTSFAFHLDAVDPLTAGRAGRLQTPHGTLETPAFMPVGTLGTVKGLLPAQLRDAGAQMVLANTYHLALRPGEKIVAEHGGLHRFMDWDGPILTDSGGFQVFSLADLRKLDDDRIVFRSHIDGNLLELTPERAVQIQEDLGADCIMCLDECPPSGETPEKVRKAVDRTTRWAERCRAAQTRTDQALFGIVQGGVHPDLRRRSAEGLLAIGFPGYAVGGLSVGEPPDVMYSTLDCTVPILPAEKPRYLMGVGRPEDILEAVCRGIDMFDCVLPTRIARNGALLTPTGRINMRSAQYAADPAPVQEDCGCYTCRTFSRAYLRHLYKANEITALRLGTIHNVHFMLELMRQIRAAIAENTFADFRLAFLERYQISNQKVRHEQRTRYQAQQRS